MAQTPPLNPPFVIPSEHAPGGFQYIGPPAKPEPPQVDRDAAARENEITIAETERLCGSAATYRWLLEKNLFGTLYRRTEEKTLLYDILHPLAPRGPREYFKRDVVMQALQHLRDMVAGLAKR